MAIRPGNPPADRSAESMLRQPQELAGKPAASHLLQQMFAGHRCALHRLRQPERELDETSVEERTADFQTVLHAHPIDFHQDIVRKIDLHVGVLRLLHWMA